MAVNTSKLKKAWLKTMEVVGDTASNIAANTQFKLNEMNLVNRRREILADFGMNAYDLWQKGETFPSSLEDQLKELSKLDEQLNILRAERLAGMKPAHAEDATAPDGDEAADDAEAQAPAEPCDEQTEEVQPDAGDEVFPVHTDASDTANSEDAVSDQTEEHQDQA